MNFELKENVIPCQKDLMDLYNNVGWSNYTNNSDILQKAIIYIQDIVVFKTYQHMGIGSRLVTEAMNKYEAVYQKVLLTDNEPNTKAFYEKMGFTTCDKYGCISFVRYSM